MIKNSKIHISPNCTPPIVRTRFYELLFRKIYVAQNFFIPVRLKKECSTRPVFQFQFRVQNLLKFVATFSNLALKSLKLHVERKSSTT